MRHILQLKTAKTGRKNQSKDAKFLPDNPKNEGMLAGLFLRELDMEAFRGTIEIQISLMANKLHALYMI